MDNTPGEVVFKVEHLSTKYAPKLQDITFDVKKGEIFGLYGLVGAGRTEVMEAVSGITHPDEGKVFLEGKEVYIKTPSEAMEKGITSVVFDRGGFIYHGKIKALADAAREAGLNF